MHTGDTQLKEFAVRAKLISQTDADKAEELSAAKGIGMRTALRESGNISDADLKRIESAVFGVPYVNLVAEDIEKDALSLIPESVARRNNVVAFRKTDRGVEVAVLELSALDSIDFLRERSGMKLLPRFTDEESMKVALGQYQKELKEKFNDIVKKEADALTSVAQRASSEAELSKIARDVSVMRVVDTLIRRALVEQASDIHIEPTDRGVVVRYRIHGLLHEVAVLPSRTLAGILARVKSLATLKLSQRFRPQEGRFKIDTGEKRVAVRVSTVPTSFGEKAVLKLLSESADGFTLEGLGLHGEALETLAGALAARDGLIVIAGPPESGKTTLLYTLLDVANDPRLSVATIESPIEYRMSGITQVQPNPASGLTAESALRSVLRQDPDVVAVGSVENEVTAHLAASAAAAGKKVIVSVEADSAAEAISQFLRADVQSGLLAESLAATVESRLVRVLGPEKEGHVISDEEFHKLAKHADMEKVLRALKDERIVPAGALWEDIRFYRPKKGGDGFGGWTGIYEVMRITSAVRALVRGGSGAEKIKSQSEKDGTLSLIEDGIFKAAQGITSLEEVMRAVEN